MRARLAVSAALTVALAVAGVVAIAQRPAPAHDTTAAPPGPGRIVDPAGKPLPGAHLQRVDDGAVVPVDATGRFDLTGDALVTVSAPGFLPRTLALTAHEARQVTLTPAEGAVSLRFGGDTMMGRRFYESSATVAGGAPLLRQGAGASEQAALLRPVAPQLADADLTVVNLETALVEDPTQRGSRARLGLHPTKELIVTSGVGLPLALQRSGIDLVDLANNHSYDALERGITRTLTALDRAGLAHVGAGHTVAEAWRPAVLTVRGQSVAFVACTTVVGVPARQGIRPAGPAYVAGPSQGGAAACEKDRLAATVRAAARDGADVVVVMIHGDVEYDRVQRPVVRDLSAVARAAGADVVMNSHPHVFGGVEVTPEAVTADTLGNAVFDQTLWETFVSGTVRVDLAGGRPVAVSVDPLLLEDYLPVPSVRGAAQSLSRIAAGLLPGLHLTTGGAEWVAPAGTGGQPSPAAAEAPTRRTVTVTGTHTLPAPWSVTDPGTARVGTDLLYGVGSFEPQDAVQRESGARLWDLGKFAELNRSSACGTGHGALLVRSPVSHEDVYLSPEHRQSVAAAEEVSLVFQVHNSTGGVAELRWYRGTEGSSTGALTLPIPEVGEGCVTLRLDAVVPAGVRAVRPFVRLTPPGGTTFATQIMVDDVRLVRWAPRGAAGVAYDTIDGGAGASVQLSAVAPTVPLDEGALAVTTTATPSG